VKSSAGAAAPAAAASATSDVWSVEQQKQLEHGLKTVPAGQTKEKNDCICVLFFADLTLQMILGDGTKSVRE
jgi:hypothetical protein